MRKLKKVYGIVLPLFLTSGTLSSEAQEWRNIFQFDFGGNAESDTTIRKYGLQESEGESSLIFKAFISNGTSYTIGKHASEEESKRPAYWTSGGDHTYIDNKEKGYFMLMNCPIGCSEGDCSSLTLDYTKSFIYQKTINQTIKAGTTFKFQTYVALMSNVDKASLGTWITIGAFDDLGNKIWQQNAIKLNPSTDGAEALNWTEIEGNCTIPEGTELNSISFRIYPITQGAPWAEALGYDFGLDDIAIYTKQPTITFSHTNFSENQPVTISATLKDDSLNKKDLEYYWEFSKDSTNWIKVATGSYQTSNTFDYAIKAFNRTDTQGQGNGYYRLTIADKNVIDSVNDETINCIRATYIVAGNATKIENVKSDDSLVDVYSIDGILIRKSVIRKEALRGLRKGFYIVGGEKTYVSK